MSDRTGDARGIEDEMRWSEEIERRVLDRREHYGMDDSRGSSFPWVQAGSAAAHAERDRLRDALRRSPGDASLLVELATAYEACGMDALAALEMRRAFDMQPSQEVGTRLVAIYRRSGKTAQADTLESALQEAVPCATAPLVEPLLLASNEEQRNTDTELVPLDDMLLAELALAPPPSAISAPQGNDLAALLEATEEYDESASQLPVGQVLVDETLSSSDRAAQIAGQLADRLKWRTTDRDLLRRLFRKYVNWRPLLDALERERRDLTPRALELALQLRRAWRAHPQLACSLRKVGGDVTRHHVHLSWATAFAMVRAFPSFPDIIELEDFLLRLHAEWYARPSLMERFRTFHVYLQFTIHLIQKGLAAA